MPTTYAIPNGRTVFDATTYSGNGSTQTITNAGAMKPDFVWVKDRTTANGHALVDSVRGAGKLLFSNATSAESGNSGDLIQSFNTSGFTVNNTYLGGSNGTTNTNSNSYVGWQWQAGQGSSSSNTSGSITSTVSVNATAGFSVVTYTGNGTVGATVGHGLGVTPAFFIVKSRSRTGNDWKVWVKTFNNNSCLLLNSTAAVNTGATGFLNSTAPSSTVITFGSDSDVNASGSTYVAYCWSEIAGFSKFGSYTGNGSTDGTFVYTGFRPSWILIKRTDASGYGWHLLDATRNTFNIVGKVLIPNSSTSESDDPANYGTDFLSNGFKLRTSGAGNNASGGTYIYACFAENPFKFANAR